MKRETYLDDMAEQIRLWDEKIDELKAKAQRAEDSADRYEREMKILIAKRAQVKSRFTQLKEATDDAWADIRTGFEHAWKDMKRAGDVVASCFKR